jgi:glyoxylase-like metal-dependent hydrolase (beta-lactamase superfamily II)
VEPGLWWWEARHPEWSDEDDPAVHGFGPEVTSYAIDDGERLLLFDPTDPPRSVAELASRREPVIVLTCPWHRRDAVGLAERLGAKIYVPPPDEHDPNPVPGELFRAGDRLSFGVRAFEGFEPIDLVLYVESRRAVVAGDTLIDRGNGLQVHPAWPGPGVAAEEVVDRLRPLLELSVEHVLPTHSRPGDRAALERALSAG